MIEQYFYDKMIYLAALIVATNIFFTACMSDVELINPELQKSLISSVLNNSKPNNFNEDEIISAFEQLQLSDSVCVQLYTPYLQAIKSKFGLENGFPRVDSILENSNCPECKLKAYVSMGQAYYARGVGDQGLSFYKKAIDQNKNNRFEGSRFLTAAQGFINGIEKLQLGMKAEGFRSIDINGLDLDLKNAEGKVVLIDFWATWCKPCKEDLPMLQSIYGKYGEREDFEMISISQDKNADILKEYLKNVDMPWTHIYENVRIESPLATQYNAFILPTYYILDKSGSIKYNFSSYRNGENLEETIDKLFKFNP